MAKELQMMLLDTKSKSLTRVMVKDELEEYYKLLDCDCIDIVERKIGNDYYDIICDDEALLNDNPIISAINIPDDVSKTEPMLFGNLLICRNNGEGETTPLTDDDCDIIDGSSTYVYNTTGDYFLVLVMDY